MDHSIVSREDWLTARRALLEKEKALTRLRDDLAAERRALPWTPVDKPYVFDGPDGPLSLSDLFAGRSQLFIKHYMMAPGQTQQCVGCAFEVDHLAGIRVHLEHHDLSYAAVARAPITEIQAYRARMGWEFPFVSSYQSDFNYDFNASFTPEQVASGRAMYNFRETNPWMEDQSGDSVFYKDETGRIFHTYSCFSRGGEQFLGAYAYIDVTPKGRQENGPTGSLADWVRPHDMYGQGGEVTGAGRYHPPACGCGAHN